MGKFIRKGAQCMRISDEIAPEVAKELAFSEEELRELDRAKAKEIVFDED